MGPLAEQEVKSNTTAIGDGADDVAQLELISPASEQEPAVMSFLAVSRVCVLFGHVPIVSTVLVDVPLLARAATGMEAGFPISDLAEQHVASNTAAIGD